MPPKALRQPLALSPILDLGAGPAGSVGLMEMTDTQHRTTASISGRFRRRSKKLWANQLDQIGLGVLRVSRDVFHGALLLAQVASS